MDILSAKSHLLEVDFVLVLAVSDIMRVVSEPEVFQKIFSTVAELLASLVGASQVGGVVLANLGRELSGEVVFHQMEAKLKLRGEILPLRL